MPSRRPRRTQAKSAIKTDNTTYASGADMLITVTLKDANGNAVTGAAASLTTEAVTVVNATLKTGSSWKDNGDGTYTGTYTATTAGTGPEGDGEAWRLGQACGVRGVCHHGDHAGPGEVGD
ncbi:Uncharacterised protein [Cedecea neteri]|uniref:Invasin domain-containing protein n=1 Tax=Cedecea neteri TaxID=158822 RepID=A0A2X2V8B1_9ENTR|nr:Uncharacterised protein [Cedecea neteri]